MGYRLHVCKVHRIEYGSEAFDNEQVFINNVLRDLIGKYKADIYGNCGDFDFSDQIEIPRPKLQEAINDLEKNGLKMLKEIMDDNSGYLEFHDSYAPHYVLNWLKRFLEEADPNDQDYIYLHWF